MGRPRVISDQSRAVNFTLNEDEYRQFRVLSAKNDVTVSEQLRRLVAKALSESEREDGAE